MVNNEIKTEDLKEEVEKEEVEEETKNEGKSALDEAKELFEQNKKLLDQISEERKKIEKATAEIMISGRSFAGQAKKEETPDEKWAREAKERYKGTGLDPT